MEPPYQRDGDAMQYLKASHAGIEPIHPSQIPEHARVMTAATFCYALRDADAPIYGGLGDKTAEAVMLAGDPDKIDRLATMVFPE